MLAGKFDTNLAETADDPFLQRMGFNTDKFFKLPQSCNNWFFLYQLVKASIVEIYDLSLHRPKVFNRAYVSLFNRAALSFCVKLC